jgi:hypothetical protein
MTKRVRILALAAVLGAGVAATVAGSAAANDGDARNARNTFNEQLTGYNEDPLVLSTSGTATFRAQINPAGTEITYRLSYTALEGTVTQSHLHFGGAAQSGGVAIFLCSNLGNGPAGTQACPAGPATVTGTITAANVIGPAAQGIAAGEFGEVIKAIRNGKVYVNEHSTLYPGGEIRSQLHQH